MASRLSFSIRTFWLWPLLLSSVALLVIAPLAAVPAWAIAWLGQPVPWPAVAVTQAALLLSSALYGRLRPDSIQGTDVITPVRALFFGPGMLGFACAGLLVVDYVAEQLVSAPVAVALQAGLLAVNLSLLFYFLTATFYTWREMLLFRAPPPARMEWLLFEVLVTGTLIATLFVPTPPRAVWAPLAGLLGLYGTYLNLNYQRWITFLARPQRLQALFLQVALLLVMVVFAFYFYQNVRPPGAVEVAQQRFFLEMILGLAAVLGAGSLLVTIFNFPAAAVFEQRRDELLDFQRQCQEIQAGTTEAEVYARLLGAALRATEADAAWLLPPGAETRHLQLLAGDELAPAVPEHLARLLGAHGVDPHLDYVNNGLSERPELAALELPYESLLWISMPAEADGGRDGGMAPGVLGLLRRASQGFDRGAVNLAQVFVNQTRLTLRNLRLTEDAVASANYRQELTIAANVQANLIPRKLPADRVLDISVWAQAAKEVGGDFYDFRSLSESRLAIIVGDVSGKGITAAFHVAQMKGIFHALLQLEHAPEPDRFMFKANSALAYCLEPRSFITASLYIIDYEQRGFAFARAGHCHTLYYNSMLEQVFYFQTPGLGLGIVRDSSYAKRVSKLIYDYNPGDVMVIYTDGITEARSPTGQEYGEERLRLMLEKTFFLDTALEIRDAMVADLQAFCAEAPVHDDQTLLVIRFKE